MMREKSIIKSSQSNLQKVYSVFDLTDGSVENCGRNLSSRADRKTSALVNFGQQKIRRLRKVTNSVAIF